MVLLAPGSTGQKRGQMNTEISPDPPVCIRHHAFPSSGSMVHLEIGGEGGRGSRVPTKLVSPRSCWGSWHRPACVFLAWTFFSAAFEADFHVLPLVHAAGLLFGTKFRLFRASWVLVCGRQLPRIHDSE